MNTVRLTVVLTSELDPKDMHQRAIDALAAEGVPVNVSDDEGIEILSDEISLALGPEPPKPPADTVHKLTVVWNNEDVEYSIEHPDCLGYQTQAWVRDDDGHDYESLAYESTTFECAIGFDIEQAGFLDALGVTGFDSKIERTTKHLEPGVYTLIPWSVTHPSTPNGPEEYDAGIEVKRIEET